MKEFNEKTLMSSKIKSRSKLHKKSSEINKYFDSSRRIVLIEKSPFVATLRVAAVACTSFSKFKMAKSGEFLVLNSGRKLMVRPITILEWEKNLQEIEQEIVTFAEDEFPSKSDYVMAIDCDERQKTLEEKKYPFLPIGTFVHKGYLDILFNKKR